MESLHATHNKYMSMPGARDGWREAALVGDILRNLGMADDYLTRLAPAEGEKVDTPWLS
jgi:hypothetical protein